MSNFEAGLSDAEFILDSQDQSDSYCLLNSILNFEESTENSFIVSDNGMGKDTMEWLDMELKEEPNHEEERNKPDTERKQKHNLIEKTRRLIIDAKIRELGYLLPKRNESYHEMAKGIKYNKGGILRASVAYLRILKSDQIKKQEIEEQYQIQELQIEKLMKKLVEYEREMKSYGIPVTPFSMQDLPELNLPHDKLKNSYGKDHLKTFEQLDDLIDEDSNPVSRKDPMFSSSPSKLSRSSSTDSTEDSDYLPYQQKKLQRKEKRKVKSQLTTHKPRPELYDAPRIPVVSRPHHFKPRIASQESSSSNESSMVLPLPKVIPQLLESYAVTDKDKVKEMVLVPTDSSLPMTKSTCSSSPYEQHWSNMMYDRKVKSAANSLDPSPSPGVIQKIQQIASITQSKSDLMELKERVIENALQRKVILQERKC